MAAKRRTQKRAAPKKTGGKAVTKKSVRGGKLGARATHQAKARVGFVPTKLQVRRPVPSDIEIAQEAELKQTELPKDTPTPGKFRLPGAEKPDSAPATPANEGA